MGQVVLKEVPPSGRSEPVSRLAVSLADKVKLCSQASRQPSGRSELISGSQRQPSGRANCF